MVDGIDGMSGTGKEHGVMPEPASGNGCAKLCWLEDFKHQKGRELVSSDKRKVGVSVKRECVRDDDDGSCRVLRVIKHTPSPSFTIPSSPWEADLFIISIFTDEKKN